MRSCMCLNPVDGGLYEKWMYVHRPHEDTASICKPRDEAGGEARTPSGE